MDHIVGVLEDANQVIPVQVALDARRVVVNSQRQVGRIGHFHEVILDGIFRCADIGWRRQDGTVGAIGARKTQVVDGGLRVVAGAAVEELHVAGFHLGRFDDNLVALQLRQHGHFAGRTHEQQGTGAVLRMPLDQGTKTLEIDAAVLVEGRDERNK